MEPALEGDSHPSIEDYALNALFYTQENRVITNDFTVRYKLKIFQLERLKNLIIRLKDFVTICEQLDGKITILMRNNQLIFKGIEMRMRKKISPIDHVLQENKVSHNKITTTYPFMGV
ncbi:hypothetical protein H0X06_02815 [Candidatus Dependentiae bacterium]|nr:hypothetical protein [Candidatus Dependentiae bacterium]